MSPRFAKALFRSLQCSAASGDLLSQLNEVEWHDLLAFCDRAQLTLTFGHLSGPFLPAWVAARIEGNLRNNAERHRQWETAALEIASCLEARGIDYAILKGPAHSPDFTPDPLLRAHGDIDIWCTPEGASRAWNALNEIGYRTLMESKGRHLAPLARPRDWKWTGDYYAPDLPIPVDVHYKLWDEDLEQIAGPPEHEFWQRRRKIPLADRYVPALSLADTLAFAALHSLMHMLHGDLRLQRAWEIAHFLHCRANDNDFWNHWRNLHPPHLRILETTMFALCAAWFHCQLPEQIEPLPTDVDHWINRYAWSPVESLFTPNKDEIWLHLALLDNARAKRSVFVRRMLPIASLPNRDREGAIASRILHHAQTALPTIFEGIKWFSSRQRLNRNLLTFLLASGLFDLGEFIFFLLYNLHLLDLGFDAKSIGQITGAMTTGSLLGVLPAARLIERLGLRNALIIALAGASVSSALRASVSDTKALLVFAFLNGVFLSVWAVCFPPIVAASTNERNRTTGFSLVSSLGISIGIAAGLLGGRLPALLARFSQLPGKRAALLLGSGIALLAVLPALRLKFPSTARSQSEKKIYPRGKFIVAFVAAVFIWSIATGAFNPFFNVYFSQRLHFTVEQIGTVFSFGQLAQVIAILTVPLFLSKIGTVKGISYAQVGTALMLTALAFGPAPAIAACTYVAYMAFQYMTEPCLFTLLMNRVSPTERSGASALNFLATSMGGALAAIVSGTLVTWLGYSFVLSAAAVLAIVAAILMFATRALYNAGNPSPRSQSLAKTIPAESSSHAGS